MHQSQCAGLNSAALRMSIWIWKQCDIFHTTKSRNVRFLVSYLPPSPPQRRVCCYHYPSTCCVTQPLNEHVCYGLMWFSPYGKKLFGQRAPSYWCNSRRVAGFTSVMMIIDVLKLIRSLITDCYVYLAVSSAV